MFKNTHIIGQIDYRSGQRVSIDVDRGEVLLALRLRLQFTITNGGSNAVGPLYQTLARIIRRLEVIVAGRDTVVSINGETLAAMQYYNDQLVALGMDASVVLTSSAATAYDITLELPFYLTNPAERPEDTALDLRGVRSCNIAITWADSACADIYTTPNSAAISGVTCTVEGDYKVGADPKEAFMVRQLDLVSQTVAAANSQLQIDIDKGSGVVVRRLFIESLVDQVGVDTIIAGMYALQANQVTFQKGYSKLLKARNRSTFKVAPVTGVLILDETLFGSMRSALPTAGLPASMQLVLDASLPSGTTRLVNITREVVRPLNLG